MALTKSTKWLKALWQARQKRKAREVEYKKILDQKRKEFKHIRG
jgi:hypothetical protein